MADYDEFALFHENSAEAGLDWRGQPHVIRDSTRVAGGRTISALRWRPSEDAQLVLLHGGAQNAHTWDTVALALDVPLVAVDLPGHGHSDWRDDGDYRPQTLAVDVAQAIEAWAPHTRAVVGMSLGGMTALCVAADHPPLVRKLGMIDVTPGVDHAKAEPIITFITGPQYFDDFDSILARTLEHNPTRSELSLRRGVLHNARELGDGRWSWRYDPMRSWKIRDADSPEPPAPDFSALWDHLDRVRVPVILWRGGRSGVVDEADVAEFCRRQPQGVVVVIDGAGHSIQGDRPLELAQAIAQFLTA